MIWLARMGMLSIFLFFFNSCGIYSFTGASIPPGAKTVSVQYFPNKAALVEPNLSSSFTNALRDIFTTQTNLEMVTKNGDLALSGEITDYTITPQAIQANQTAALNRLTVTVNVKFVNKLDPAKSFEQQFSQYVDYSSSQSLDQVKNSLLKQITDNLAQNIFDKAVVNW
ncbi:MAG: LptE family protein [Bacteroidales bacterium]|nr:LptE family protein [Bacteroidales bacterium]